MAEQQRSVEMGLKNLPETTNTSKEPAQSSSSGQDQKLESTAPSMSTEDVGDSTPRQLQSPVYTNVEIALPQVSDFMLETSKSPEIEEHQSQLPQLDNSEDQQIMTQEDYTFATKISEPELLDCLVHKLEEIISSQEDKKPDNLTENELPEKLQLQFDKPNDNTRSLSTLSQDLFLSDSPQESKQAVNLESDVVCYLEKTPVKNVNQIETEEEFWNDDSMQELQELEELGYSVVVPTQPKTQSSESSEEAGHNNQTTSLSFGNQMLSSQESSDQINLNVQICSIPLESLKPLFHESNDVMLSEQSITEKSPQLFSSDSSQFENDKPTSQTSNENTIIISNVCSLSTKNMENITNIDEKNISQDSFEEILDDNFAKQLQELEEFGYEVVAPIQSEVDGENKSHDQDNSQPSPDDILPTNKIHGSALQDTKMQQNDVDTNSMMQGDQVGDGSINISIITQENPFEPLLSSQEINTQTKDTGSQDSCATAMSENKTASEETQSSSKKGSSSKISDIIDEFLDSYADEIDVDDMDPVDMNDDCDLIPHQLADNSTLSSSNLTNKISSKSPLHSNEKLSQCHGDQICFSNSKHDKELKATADLLIGKQPFCSEMKIAIPKEAIATEASLPNLCSTISLNSTDTATLPEQSSSASMPTESRTTSNTTLSYEEGKVSSKKTRSIQTDATLVNTMATQTKKMIGSDMSTQTSLTMQHLNEIEIPCKEENKPQKKIHTRSSAFKEWTENTDPETNSSQSSNEGLPTNKRAKRKCTQEQNLLPDYMYPMTRKNIFPPSNNQKIDTICNESSAKNYMDKGNTSKKILSGGKSLKNTAKKILLGERKVFKERISTTVDGNAFKLPKRKERRASSQLHNSDSSSPGSSGKSSPASSSMTSCKKGSPDSSDSTSSPEQKARKGKKSQEQVMQAGHSAGSPPEAKKKKLSQDECSMRNSSESQQEQVRKGLRLGLSRCAKLKSLLKKQ